LAPSDPRPASPFPISLRNRGSMDLAPECPDESHVRYFVLGTMAAIVALFLNVFYPLIYQTHWR
uniref:Uncharacterized protein n=1 Tax=Anolis carolinensis TaxID=28377 RepID=A0A803T372_ANOCA